jgi:hypothetical protein
VNIRVASIRDPLWFINTFVWTYDPRLIDEGRPVAVPFITYPKQDRMIMSLLNSIGHEDMQVPKSRGVGATYSGCTCLTYLGMFWPMLSFLLASRVETDVDSGGDPGTLFWKIDKTLAFLPSFLKPRIANRRHLHLEFADTGSVIDGTSTTKFIGTSDRRTAVVIDEWAKVENQTQIESSTADVTKSRIYFYSVFGTGTLAEEMALKKSIRTFNYWWYDHPPYTVGGIWDDPDPLYKGLKTSAWLEAEKQRRQTRNNVMQEIHGKWVGAGDPFFEKETLDRMAEETVQDPWYEGEIERDIVTNEPLRFREYRNGALKLWVNLDMDGKPPAHGRYGIGADIGGGSDLSNSCAVVVDLDSGEKVAEYTVVNIDPAAFGFHCYALAKFFNSAVINWDNRGPGQTFTTVLQEQVFYDNLYYHRNKRAKGATKAVVPGFPFTSENRRQLLEELRRQWNAGLFTERSEEVVLREAPRYTYQGITVIYEPTAQKDRETGARMNHGDRVMATALAAWLMFTEGHLQNLVAEVDPPERTYAAMVDEFWRNKRQGDDPLAAYAIHPQEMARYGE